jgi:hypothetical protein
MNYAVSHIHDPIVLPHQLRIRRPFPAACVSPRIFRGFLEGYVNFLWPQIKLRLKEGLNGSKNTAIYGSWTPQFKGFSFYIRSF